MRTGSDMDEVVKNVPNDKLMLETDAPYMTPPPKRNQRNVPSNVQAVAEYISNIKNLTFKEIIDMTSKNAKTFFKLPLIALLFLFSFSLLVSSDLFSQSQSDYYDDEEYD